jgi:fibronectin-binding autotransporter adhesin
VPFENYDAGVNPRKSGAGGAVLIARRTFTAVGITTDTVPAGASRATVRCIGAGGGYVGSTSRSGGGGAYARSDIRCSPGQTATITCGARGTSGAGVNGEPTSVVLNGMTVSAAGGFSDVTGGQASNSTGTVTRSGGNGGNAAGVAGSAGDHGGAGGAADGTFGGGGGSAGDIGDIDSLGLGSPGMTASGGAVPASLSTMAPGAGGNAYAVTGGSGRAVIEYWSA